MGVDPVSLAILGTVAGGSILSGIGQAQAAEEQADIIGRETTEAAKQRKKQIQALASRQKVDFLKSGVTLEGTPIDIFADTFKTGQEDIDTIIRSGRSQQRAVISRGRSALTSSLISGIGQAAFGAGNLFNTGLSQTGTVTSASQGFGQFIGSRAPVPGVNPFRN